MHIVVLWVMTVGQSAKWLPQIGGIWMASHNSEKIFFLLLRKQGLNVDYVQEIKIVLKDKDDRNFSTTKLSVKNLCPLC